LLYVREGCRLVGDFVFDTSYIAVNNGFRNEQIAIGYYGRDSKIIRRIVSGGVVKGEGAKLTGYLATNEFGFPIPAKIMFPKVAECTNMLVVGQPSLSREVWLSLRMSMTLMEIGYAGGVAAAQLAENGGNVQDIDVPELVKTVDVMETADKIILTAGSDSYFQNQGTDTVVGTWTLESNRYPYVGQGAKTIAAGSTASHTFALNVWKTAAYEVCFMYTPADSIGNGDVGRATNLSVTINHADRVATRTVNQQYPGGHGGFWESLGIFTFRYGAPSPDTVVINAAGSNGIVSVAAIGLRLIE
jgi:hypothetical protein